MSRFADLFAAWQTSPWVHSLTCRGGGSGSDHVASLAVAEDHRTWLLLRCPECAFTQRIDAEEPLGQAILSGPPKSPWDVLREQQEKAE